MLWHTGVLRRKFGAIGGGVKRGVGRRPSHWLIGCLLALSYCGLIAVPSAWAAPQSCALQITNHAPVDTTVYLVEGVIRDASNQPVVGVTVNVLIDAVQVASGSTGPTGFSIRIPRPTPGSHALSAQWVGNDQWGPSSRSQQIEVPAPLTTEISLTVTPTTVSPGSTFTVNGTLTSRGSPVADALIEVGLSWGGDSPATAMTAGDGAFDLFLGVPEGENPPNGLSVIARFAGDGYYPATSRDVQLTLSVPTPSPTPETSPTPSESASPLPASSASASASASAGPARSTHFDYTSPLFILAMVFFVVVTLATGTLLVIAVVSRRNTALAADERRGFGSNFGSGEADDEDLADLDDIGPDEAGPAAADAAQAPASPPDPGPPPQL
ncbi:MAG: hypothetical protein LBK54_05535 [Propionibacteriaceae bacterium]|jgi:hypothetical protein|nr:hypothetical protein [Propionibacteriaceae bacterium]